MFLTDNPNFIQHIQINETELSDHNIIKVFTTFFHNSSSIPPTEHSHKLDFSKISLKTANFNQINYELSTINWNELIELPLDDFHDTFRHIVYSILSKHSSVKPKLNKKMKYSI